MCKFNIGIDLDDVLADFMRAYTALAFEIFGRPALGTEPVDWEWTNYGLSKDEQQVVWDRIAETPNFWTTLSVEPGATWEMMERLKKHNNYFITARVQCNGDTIQHQSCQWLLNNFGLSFPQVLVSYDKGPLAAALKLDYFVDDRPKNVLEIKNAVPTCKTFLKDASHNQKFNDPRIERVKDFDTFVRFVEGDAWTMKQ